MKIVETEVNTAHNEQVDNTVSEAAAKLKLSAASIRRLIADRALTAIRSGQRKWLVPDEAIQEYRTRQTSIAINTKSEPKD